MRAVDAHLAAWQSLTSKDCFAKPLAMAAGKNLSEPLSQLQRVDKDEKSLPQSAVNFRACRGWAMPGMVEASDEAVGVERAFAWQLGAGANRGAGNILGRATWIAGQIAQAVKKADGFLAAQDIIDMRVTVGG